MLFFEFSPTENLAYVAGWNSPLVLLNYLSHFLWSVNYWDVPNKYTVDIWESLLELDGEEYRFLCAGLIWSCLNLGSLNFFPYWSVLLPRCVRKSVSSEHLDVFLYLNKSEVSLSAWLYAMLRLISLGCAPDWIKFWCDWLVFRDCHSQEVDWMSGRFCGEFDSEWAELRRVMKAFYASWCVQTIKISSWIWAKHLGRRGC